jgi:dihydrofolate reductase/AraC-like DNA-binding protein
VEYVSVAPRAPLDGLIHDLYYLEGAPPYSRLMLPRRTRSVGVHFKPWGQTAFAVMQGRLASACGPQEMLARLEAELDRRRREVDGPDLVRHMSTVIAATGGTVPIKDLGVTAGVSSTHAAKRFKGVVGVTPKRLARSYRFTSTMLALDFTAPIDWSDVAAGAGYFDQAHLVREFREFAGLTPTRYVEARQRFLRDHPGHVLDGWPLPVDSLQAQEIMARHTRDTPGCTGGTMGDVVMYASVSVDGFIAAGDDDPGSLFEWLTGGDVPLDDGGFLKVSQASFDYVRPYWDQIGVTIAGRHVFDMTSGWDGVPPSGIDHVVVVTHRPAPGGWDAEAPFHFVDGVQAAVAKAQELAGPRIVEVAAGDVGGQVLAAGLVDEVRMDVAPVVLGSGKRYFGSVRAQHLLEDPDVVIQGNRVLHVRYRVRNP